MAHEYANDRYQFQMASAARVICGTAKWPFRILLFALMNTGHRWRSLDRSHLSHQGHQIEFSFLLKTSFLSQYGSRKHF